MKIEYLDRINAKAKVEVKVSAKVAHILEEDKEYFKPRSKEEIENLSKRKQNKYYQQEFEAGFRSLDEIMDNGFQPSSSSSIENELARQIREERYFKSNEYKAFRKKLPLELKKQMPKMSESVKNAMYLRFFKNLSIGGVARELGISKGAAQTSIQRGCKYIKDFLDADIKFQNRKERGKFTKNKY